MIDLKVSKEIYLICTIFSSIIKYECYLNQNKNLYEKKIFILPILKKNIFLLAVKQKIWFLKKKGVWDEK